LSSKKKSKHKYPKTIGGYPHTNTITGEMTYLRDHPGERVYGHYGNEWTGTKKEKLDRARMLDEQVDRMDQELSYGYIPTSEESFD
jgi:hypothetical protein